MHTELPHVHGQEASVLARRQFPDVICRLKAPIRSPASDSVSVDQRLEGAHPNAGRRCGCVLTLPMILIFFFVSLCNEHITLSIRKGK